MVTVLGAHKLLETLDSQEISPASRHLAIDLANASSEVTNALPVAIAHAQQTPAPLATASLDAGHQALSAAGEVPLSALTPSEVIDVDFDMPVMLTDANYPPGEAEPGPIVALAPSAVKTAEAVIATATDEQAGGTSYDDLSVDPVELGESPTLQTELAAKEVYVPEWQTYTVQAGDTFAVMAERSLGLGYRETTRIIKSLPDKRVLTHWRIGDSLDYKLDEDGNLLALRIMKDARRGFMVKRDPQQDSFSVAKIEKATQATQRLFAGTVSGSFSLSAEATGLGVADVTQLTQVLGKKIDFRRDTRKGDKFQVLVESDMIDGTSTDSRILAARYEGTRKSLTVVRNAADGRYYTPDGKGLDPAFNRYPLAHKARISSPFNLSRRHPVTGRISPHKGTDFAVRVGTPVLSTADGVVELVGNHPLAGRYLVLRMDNGYKTRYLHLSRPLVKKGERVKMGEKIALSGNTGRSTGPHLHYEVMVNNRQVDAMRVQLPNNKSLSGKALAAFKRESQNMLAKLEAADNTGAIAKASTPTGSDES
ncbi:peptidoglycan DD-metalloendopeptidase family protein [Cobetia marina]|jgi:murein DD-endopeptidase|uniref:peptidoglycan DD-metalloendopeptidase family protein n=1 Tax=Cobetia TaxID=204286 RepID=UPI0021003BC1|nr:MULTISPECIES: peptidoglycan DD-metalloendopeptidase family protein [Cobetia]MDO6787119.1 peptidoglycan DD-metalloendopeptidase family protein [Cobetia marina]